MRVSELHFTWLVYMQGNSDVVQYLINEQRCNLQCEDKDGCTPLYFIQEKTSKMLSVINELCQLYKTCKRRSFPLTNSQLCGMSVKFVLKDTNCTTTLHWMCSLVTLMW